MYLVDHNYDVVVIGAGHAGCEAALAAARIGVNTLVITMNLDNIALMPCNPAIGGLGKGHLVREIDALGGEMGKNIDCTGIQFRRLNTRKGPAVQALRAQADKNRYKERMKEVLEREPNLSIRQAEVSEIIVECGVIRGVRTVLGEVFSAAAVIVTSGTFLNGLIHVGMVNYSAGRAGEQASCTLSASIMSSGFSMGRLKTGTTPRLHGCTVDTSGMIRQNGDDEVMPFSFQTKRMNTSKLPCYITYTNEKTHSVIKKNMHRSPLYGGAIRGIGPRYCPSIEDKIMRFPNRDRHQIFVEPEGLLTSEIYPNGISTSLPVDVQEEFLSTIPGFENAKILRPGYAIEYDFILPTQLTHSLMAKSVKNFFSAGQVNGTSGYEEAAAQGIVAGINAARAVRGEELIVFPRVGSYIGVMIDDLISRGVKEPYRVFTSRAERRLILREDNADQRLSHIGRKVGLISEEKYKRIEEKFSLIREEQKKISSIRIFPLSVNNSHEKKSVIRWEGCSQPQTILEILRRPEINYSTLHEITGPGVLSNRKDVIEQVELNVKYEGYIKREEEEFEKMKKLEEKAIPPDFDYTSIKGLTKEVQDQLNEVRPTSLGQARRIPGVTPAAISVLMVYLKRRGTK